MNRIIYRWHNRLDMQKFDFAWHEKDVAEEFRELKEAQGFINVWSELSDVAYTYTRAHWTGHTKINLPISHFKYFLGLIYMFPKFSLRWNFYDELGREFGKNIKIREVRNPKKIEKLKIMANIYGLDEDKFVDLAIKKMKNRIFFK